MSLMQKCNFQAILDKLKFKISKHNVMSGIEHLFIENRYPVGYQYDIGKPILQEIFVY